MNRSSFLIASTTAALAGAGTAGGAAAATVPGGTHLVERASDFDRRAFDALVGRPADIRQLFEAVSFNPLIFGNMKNAFNGLQFGFAYPANRIAMVFCPHGPSSAYNFSDYVWSKYKIGEAFKLKDAKGATLTHNAFLKAAKPVNAKAGPDSEDSLYQATDIESLQKRGVIFLTCHTAVEEQSRKLVAGGFAPSGMTPAQVADDILSHLIPGTHVIPSMVATVAVLQQQHHYAYTTVDFT